MAVDSFRYPSPASAAIVKAMIARAPRDPLPWTALHRPLFEATIALVSTAAISRTDDVPFDTEGERNNPWWGDPSYRVIRRDTKDRNVVAVHLHIENRYIHEDLNVALPLARLAELEGDGSRSDR